MTQTHWADYFTRGILTLLSFSNLGTGIRCFIDSELVVNRLFQVQFKESTLSHLFGCYSILMSLIFSQSAIYLYVYPLTRLVYGCILSYLSLFIAEICYFKSLTLTPQTCFPLLINAVTLIWILIFHLWKPYRLDANDPERESLLTHGLPISKIVLKHRRKANKAF